MPSIDPMIWVGIVSPVRWCDPNIIISSSKIITVVCAHFDIEQSKITGKGRSRRLVEIRQIICYFLKKYTRLTLERIGLLVNRDHSTVTYSISEIGNRIKLYMEVKKEMELIESKLI